MSTNKSRTYKFDVFMMFYMNMIKFLENAVNWVT